MPPVRRQSIESEDRDELAIRILAPVDGDARPC
jgi:hypothetical protein